MLLSKFRLKQLYSTKLPKAMYWTKKEEETSILSQEQKALQAQTKTINISKKRSKAIKPLDDQYGKVEDKHDKLSILKRVPRSMQTSLASAIHQLDQTVDKALFSHQEIEVTREEAQKLDPRTTAIIKQGEGSSTSLANNVNRNIFTEDNELAEKVLTDNIIDFHDQRINVSTQK